MPDFREQYEKAQQLGKLAFVERPYFGSPAAPAQAEILSHLAQLAP